MGRLQRRVFLTAAGALLAASPVAWSQGLKKRLGILATAGRPETGPGGSYRHLLDALGKAGWVEGRNLQIDYRYAEGELARLLPLATELVARKTDVILASTQPAATAAMKATQTIPIVFVIVPEPVESGLAQSLARPGGNATGFATMNAELVAKRVSLMREAFPATKRMALLYQADFDMNVRQAALAEQAARALGIQVLRVGIGQPKTYDAAFASLVESRPDAVLVIENPSVFTNRADIVRRMAEARLAAMYGFQEFSLVGGLISYSVNFPDQFRRAADYVDRILRGAKPGDLPIQQPLRFELTVNLKTAKSLGLTIPQTILLRADRVIA